MFTIDTSFEALMDSSVKQWNYTKTQPGASQTQAPYSRVSNSTLVRVIGKNKNCGKTSRLSKGNFNHG